MEALGLLFAPFFSGAVTLAAPPPSSITFHRFMYATTISSTSIILIAVFRIESNLKEIEPSFSLSVVVGVQLIMALLVIAGMHIYLSTSVNRAKCARLIEEQKKVEELIRKKPGNIDTKSHFGGLKAAKKDLASTNCIITVLVAIVYAALVLAVFPKILIFVNNAIDL